MGGCVFTNDQDIANKIRKLANHGRNNKFQHDLIGWNSRLDNLKAAYLNLALEVLPNKLESRRKAQSQYLRKLFVPQLQSSQDFFDNAYCQVCLFENSNIRKKVISTLDKNNIGYSIIYPTPISEQKALKGLTIKKNLKNISREFCKRVLSLPLFPYIKNKELNLIIDIVNSAYLD